MTVEIAVMNKEAIALAADSAVTMTGESGQKIFTSANKLFTLSKYHPIGVMVYGSAIFMGVPWEVIIKVYRKKLGQKRFDTLGECAKGFVAFLDNGNPLFPESVQNEYLGVSIYAYFRLIKDTITRKVHASIDEKGKITSTSIKEIVTTIIDEHYQKWEKTPNIPSIPKRHNSRIADKHKRLIRKAIREVFEKLPITRALSDQLERIAASLFSKFPEGIRAGSTSGVVIAGFGDKDTFPSLESFLIEGIVLNKLKYKGSTSSRIDFTTSASIVPFAQSEMIATFMEGVDPSYRVVQESYLSRIFNDYADVVINSLKRYRNDEKGELRGKLARISKRILEDLRKKLDEYRKEKYISPVTSVVSMLPKDELAAMAESLVNLTSFKRKVTMESETVGGPIDVALISKGDGFIWIKRKHYFKAELNPHFAANYFKET